MNAYYVANGAYDAILIPLINQVWFSPNSEDMQKFLSTDNDFKDWEGEYCESLASISENEEDVFAYWNVDCESTVVAQMTSGKILKVYDNQVWQNVLDEISGLSAIAAA